MSLRDRVDEARATLEHVRSFKPDVSLTHIRQVLPSTHMADRERFFGGLSAAGMAD